MELTGWGIKKKDAEGRGAKQKWTSPGLKTLRALRLCGEVNFMVYRMIIA
jgi:hypothetical protein